MRSKESGFTLVEMLLVLTIVMVISITIFSQGSKAFQEREAEHFYDLLVRDTLYLQSLSLKNKEKTVIEFNERRSIYIAKFRESNKLIFQREMPQNLKILNHSTMNRVGFNERGNASYVGKIVFEIKGNQKELFVYLGAGRVYLNEK
ncbi:competence protein ComG [Kurthia zopfii]|uniref:Pilin/secretion family protein with methylation motif n=1 Tax=Kurthia zopfii TaxID=1650 RepID=A0A2U3AA65_9BACL|nr:competence type IV pilus minor pilin ComGD [Kurthia zopfii]PWI21429.1 hypothetical protein DF281_12245 [Kurthia zopfii]TDR34514.1 pilin/secretion family protein with methylation motif [Kurthia zopfii]STX10000.1 Tfp pilus assembly protein FimT [Kurthia zopfii]VEI07573.1 Tfp pilus assembly protein FimT [Kurthia zopfii]GEK31651.1 competence protein ComG [Kurthia zopfii]